MAALPCAVGGLVGGCGITARIPRRRRCERIGFDEPGAAGHCRRVVLPPRRQLRSGHDQQQQRDHGGRSSGRPPVGCGCRDGFTSARLSRSLGTFATRCVVLRPAPRRSQAAHHGGGCGSEPAGSRPVPEAPPWLALGHRHSLRHRGGPVGARQHARGTDLDKRRRFRRQPGLHGRSTHRGCCSRVEGEPRRHNSLGGMTPPRGATIHTTALVSPVASFLPRKRAGRKPPVTKRRTPRPLPSIAAQHGNPTSPVGAGTKGNQRTRMAAGQLRGPRTWW